MTEFSALTVFAGLPVRDLTLAIEWYERVLGRAPDARPAPQIADYYLTVDRVPEHGTLQLREDADRAGGGMTTINVEDITVIAQSLANLQVAFDTQEFPIDAVTVSSVTVGTFEDPDGNAVTIVQPHLRSTD
ncbi:VOC family protein [Salinibacterium sp. NSLL150]|uniref:VOC family protein n=1 Tax=unclassified Salinibacterium TaxID=2632331 RepID=UPI0018CE060C|nr:MULTISPECIES: VOC family protein [unclassified Salinibacterium]MBH0097539.1 VOC family protein [Salinibacterium sp. NSLL35]MBH0100294.1 VOC family protein [Salinibacterium sp. NSLL150]MBH0103053.1 VOC family protein [Salinibacterium sp. NSLL16]MBH0105814.1 VOC family protein [Salinibacterium sp. NSLL17]MBH0117131.1 VOC family protein [Salinibacterium sp. NG253]